MAPQDRIRRMKRDHRDSTRSESSKRQTIERKRRRAQKGH